MKTKRIHYITNAVGTEHRTFDTVAEAKEYASKTHSIDCSKRQIQSNGSTGKENVQCLMKFI